MSGFTNRGIGYGECLHGKMGLGFTSFAASFDSSTVSASSTTVASVAGADSDALTDGDDVDEITRQ